MRVVRFVAGVLAIGGTGAMAIGLVMAEPRLLFVAMVEAAGALVLWLAAALADLFSRRRRGSMRAQVSVFDDVPGLVDARPLCEQFRELDQALRHPANFRFLMAATRARKRDKCNPSVHERVAWVGLWQQLEHDDNNKPDGGVSV